MKKIATLALTIVALYTNAQNINDALRFSQTDLGGTARFKAMSGAFGALGGDLSAINVNPAGSSIFANNQLGISLSNNNYKNDSNYYGKNTSDNDNTFDLNQIGAVFTFENNRKKSNWKKLGLAINYENIKSLDNSLNIAGTNPTNSVDNYFLYYADGLPLSTLDGSNYNYDELFFNEQQAYLAYQSYLIDPTANTPTNNTYYTNISNAGNYYQENGLSSKGYNGKVNFNISGQFTDKWYFGLNLNAHFVDYRQSTFFFENNNNPKYAIGSTVDTVRFYNDLYTYGNGFSFQLGTIFKPTPEIRLGLVYDSPTWLTLNDELSQRINTSGYGLNTAQDNTIYGTGGINPNRTMVYEPYGLKTPSKFTASFAYVFAKKGLISLDYIFKDYSSTKLTPKKDFTATNNYMGSVLDATSEVRIGAEYKIQKFSLRGGYRYEQSPYKDKKTIGDLTGYSGGLGYNFGSTKVDLAYVASKRDYYHQMFNVGLTDAAKINSKNNTVTLTVLFEM